MKVGSLSCPEKKHEKQVRLLGGTSLCRRRKLRKSGKRKSSYLLFLKMGMKAKWHAPTAERGRRERPPLADRTHRRAREFFAREGGDAEKTRTSPVSTKGRRAPSSIEGHRGGENARKEGM